jgi:site-specific DNA-methyltransferase (adenine-specific)
MAESIKKLGVIQPLVVTPHPTQTGKYLLVAGERRYRGCLLAGVSDVPVVLREGAESLMAEIELEENVCRADLNYEEEGNLLRKIQQLKKKENPGYTLDELAKLTNRSTGDVSSKINISKKLESRPELKGLIGNSLPMHAMLKRIDQIEESERLTRLQTQGAFTFTTELLLGNAKDLILNIPDESIDLLLTDPPYGLEKIENLREQKITKRFAGHASMSEHHNQSIDSVRGLLYDLGEEFARVLKPGAHFYMFTAFQYAESFIQRLEPMLNFQPPLLVWNRGKPSSPGMGYNYLSCLEAIIYGCKPPRTKRLQKDMYNIIECPDVPKNLRMYPTEKPVPLLQTLIQQSTMINDLVLDPFAGSGSTLVAAKKSGRRAIGFEINKEIFIRTQQRLQRSEEGVLEGAEV